MKKILAYLFTALLIVGCSKTAESFKGFEYATEVDGTKITISFAKDEDRVFGQVVNRFFGAYTLDGSNITFGPLGSTMMMGPEEAMKVENNFMKFMASVNAYSLQGNTLTLKTSEGSEMSFEKTGEIQQ